MLVRRIPRRLGVKVCLLWGRTGTLLLLSGELRASHIADNCLVGSCDAPVSPGKHKMSFGTVFVGLEALG